MSIHQGPTAIRSSGQKPSSGVGDLSELSLQPGLIAELISPNNLEDAVRIGRSCFPEPDVKEYVEKCYREVA